jgi:hypothetical protein
MAKGKGKGKGKGKEKAKTIDNGKEKAMAETKAKARDNIFDSITLLESLGVKLRERQEQAYKENMVAIDKEYNTRASAIETQLCAIGESENITWQDNLARSIVAKYVVAPIAYFDESDFDGYFSDYVAGIESTFNCKLDEQVKVLSDYESIMEKVPEARKVLKSFLGHLHGGFHFAPKKNIHKSKVYAKLWENLS